VTGATGKAGGTESTFCPDAGSSVCLRIEQEILKLQLAI
jgi:hypothetical protein